MAEQRINMLESEISHLTHQNHDLECQLQLLSDQYDDLLAQLNSKDSLSDLYQAEVAALHQKLDETESNLKESYAHRTFLKVAKETATETEDRLRSDMEATELRNEALERDNENLKADVYEKELEFENLLRDNDGLSAVIREKISEIEKLEAEVNSYERSAEKAESDLEAAGLRIEDLERELERKLEDERIWMEADRSRSERQMEEIITLKEELRNARRD